MKGFTLISYLTMTIIVSTSASSYDEDYEEDMMASPVIVRRNTRRSAGSGSAASEPMIYNLPSNNKPSKSPLFFSPGSGTGLFGGQSIFAPSQPARTILLPTASALTACCACAPAAPASSGALIASPGFTASGNNSFPTVCMKNTILVAG